MIQKTIMFVPVVSVEWKGLKNRAGNDVKGFTIGGYHENGKWFRFSTQTPEDYELNPEQRSYNPSMAVEITVYENLDAFTGKVKYADYVKEDSSETNF